MKQLNALHGPCRFGGPCRAVPVRHGSAVRAVPVHGPHLSNPYSARNFLRSVPVQPGPVLYVHRRLKKRFRGGRSGRFGPFGHLYLQLSRTKLHTCMHKHNIYALKSEPTKKKILRYAGKVEMNMKKACC